MLEYIILLYLFGVLVWVAALHVVFVEELAEPRTVARYRLLTPFWPVILIPLSIKFLIFMFNVSKEGLAKTWEAAELPEVRWSRRRDKTEGQLAIADRSGGELSETKRG